MVLLYPGYKRWIAIHVVKTLSARERQTLPQIILTGDTNWDPRVLDMTISDSSDWNTPLGNSIPLVQHNPFDEFGDYQRIEVENHFTDGFLENPQGGNDIDDVIDHCIMHTLVEDHRKNMKTLFNLLQI